MQTVMVFGTFDIVHMGHLHMFKEALQYGDKLVAVVARDANVEKIKGEKPYYSEEERCEFLKYIKIIDQVLLGDKINPYKTISIVKPDTIALGYDQKIFVDQLEEQITSYGLEIKIVRLKPYFFAKYSSKQLKKYIERIV